MVNLDKGELQELRVPLVWRELQDPRELQELRVRQESRETLVSQVPQVQWGHQARPDLRGA